MTVITNKGHYKVQFAYLPVSKRSFKVQEPRNRAKQTEKRLQRSSEPLLLTQSAKLNWKPCAYPHIVHIWAIKRLYNKYAWLECDTWARHSYQPPLLQGCQPQPHAEGCQFVVLWNWGRALAVLWKNLKHSPYFSRWHKIRAKLAESCGAYVNVSLHWAIIQRAQ